MRQALSTRERQACGAGLCAVSLLAIATSGASAEVYELVSPINKNGVDVQSALKVSDAGDAIAWLSIGGYADPVGFNAFDAYIARREGAEWKVSPLYPRATESIRPGLTHRLGGIAFSADLREAAVLTGASFDPADDDRTFGVLDNQDVYQLSPGDAPIWASKQVDGPPPNEPVSAELLGVSADGSSIFFRTSEALSRDVTTGTGIQHVYRWREGTTELVGRDENGNALASGSKLAGGGTAAFVSGNAGDLPDSAGVSTDGETFVYGSSDLTSQVYLYQAGGTVTRISTSQAAATRGDPSTEPATFLAALPDFSAVYFRSGDRLSDDAPVGGGDYKYDLRTRTLTFSNVDESLTYPVGPRGFIRASNDGRYVYFTSTLGLAPGGTVGEVDLYVTGPDGIRFVASLSEDDTGLTLLAGKTSPFTPTGISDDGSKFLFSTFGRQTMYDNAGHRQIYLYDAANGSLRCVSCNPFASASTGDASITNDSEVSTAAPRSLSDDGRTAVFVSQEGLVREDTNRLQDVYQYADGVLSIVSDGSSPRSSSFMGMAKDASIKFIITRSQLSPRDTDNGLADVYSVTAGEPVDPPTATPECAGDDCQGPPGTGPQLSDTPGTAGFGFAPDLDESLDDASFKLGKLDASALKRAAETGTIKIRVVVTKPVQLGATLRAFSGKRSHIAGRTSRWVAEPGSVVLSLKLGSRARRRLASRRRLSVLLSVTGEGVSSARRFTLRATKKTRIVRAATAGVVR